MKKAIILLLFIIFLTGCVEEDTTLYNDYKACDNIAHTLDCDGLKNCYHTCIIWRESIHADKKICESDLGMYIDIECGKK